MRKFISYTLVVIMVLTMLTSCITVSLPQKTQSSTNTDTNLNSEVNTETNTNTSTETNSGTGTSTDTNNDVLITEVISWQFNYDYGFHRENVVTLLVDYSKLMTGFENVIIPDDIVAGDIINIEYTGDIFTETIYPGRTSLYNGEVISYWFDYADVIPVSTENLTEAMLEEYQVKNRYVVLDREGSFTTLEEYTGEIIYLVEDQQKVKPRTVDTPLYVASMLAYNPRDLEDGQVPSISSSEALGIAEEHFYNNYAEDGVGFEYTTGMGTHDDGNWEVFFKKLYTNGTIGDAYYYTIDKTTGEILSISIEEENLKNETIKTSRFMYTYGFDCRYSEDIPYAVLLTGDSYLSGGFGDIEVPDVITAGDTISIVHTGSIITQETYPGRSYLENGEVISYSFNYAEVIHLEGENYSAEAVKSNYSHRYYRPYVILDRSGRYISLDNYTGDELYLVVDEVRGKNSDRIEEEIPEGMIPVACMLAYNPRDLEDGIPGEMYVPPLISEEDAVALASECFYNKFDYKLPPEGYEYKAEIIEHWNTSYYHVLFSLVYVGDSTEAVLPDDAVSYTIRVSKALNEISMIITNR